MPKRITSQEAQRDHEALSHSKKVGEQHRARQWKDCQSCLARLQRTGTTVIGR